VAARPSFYQSLLRITAGLHLLFALAVTLTFTQRYAALPASALGIVLALVALFFARQRILNLLNDKPRGRFGSVVVDQLYFVHWCACVFLLLPGAVLWPLLALALKLVSTISPAFAGIVVYGSGSVIAAWGVLFRRRLLRVERHDVIIRNLPQAFHGYVIAHVSDLHVGSMSSRSMLKAMVTKVNASNADLVVATGDYVTSGTAFHADIATLLGSLQGKDGTVASMGNHDYFGDGEPLLAALKAKGVRVLRNEGELLSRAGQSIYCAGVDDTWTKRADLEKTLAQAPQNVPVILLAHDPALFEHAAKKGVALTLSGHTHAGQIAVPWFTKHASLSHLAHKFHVGFYREGESQLYVHPGLGTTGPPIRVGAAPTVTILTLRGGASTSSTPSTLACP
jgi:uncharacterized protein